MTVMLERVFSNRLDKRADFIAERIVKREKAADFAIIASNTPHRVFNKREERVKVPVISIAEKRWRRIQSDRVEAPFILIASLKRCYLSPKGSIN
jgi:aspartate racemase